MVLPLRRFLEQTSVPCGNGPKKVKALILDLSGWVEISATTVAAIRRLVAR